MSIYEKDYSILLGDVGETNQITNRSILKYLQEIAGTHSGIVGYGLNDTERTHVAWVLLNWKLELYKRPSWGGALTIKTWPRVTEKFYSFREFEIYLQGELIGIASSKWVIFDTQKNRLGRITDQMKQEYDCVDKSVFEIPIQEKLKEPEDGIETYHYQIGRRDIDTNHHVNNLCYLDFAYEALPQDVFENVDFKKIEIMYKREAVLGDKIVCRYSQTSDDEYYVSVRNAEENKLHAVVRFRG